MNWLQKVHNIINEPSPTLKNLARSVGADPSIFYVNLDLSECDLRGEDLSGMDLTGTRISAHQLDSRSIIDEEFDPRRPVYRGRRYFELNPNVEGILRDHSRRLHYKYNAWTAKHLVYKAYTFGQGGNDDFKTALRLLKGSASLKTLIVSRVGARYPYRITIDDQAHQFVRELGRHFASQGVGYPAAIVLGFLVDYRVPWSKISQSVELEAYCEAVQA